MSAAPKLTIAGLFLFLRTKFLLAREQKNKDIINVMFDTFDYICEASEDPWDNRVWFIAEEFVCCARDSLYDVEWKGTVPSQGQVEQLEGTRLTIADLFVFLRKRLLIARASQDEGEISRLMPTFRYLEDAAHFVADKDVINIATAFSQSATDVELPESKSPIPTEEDIQHFLSDHD